MLDLIGELQAVLVAEGEREGEVGRGRLRIGEHVAELESELLIVVEVSRNLSHDTPPLLLMRWHDSEGRLQPLVV